jgi:hypothetical protein
MVVDPKQRWFVNKVRFIYTVLFHLTLKIDSLGCPSTKKFIVIIGPIIHNNGSRIKLELRVYLHIRDSSFIDNSKTRYIPIMIQKQVQLNGPFGSTKIGAIKHLRIEIEWWMNLPRSIYSWIEIFSQIFDLNPAAIKEFSDPIRSAFSGQEGLLVEFSRTMFIGMG